MPRVIFERKIDNRISYRWAADDEPAPPGAVVMGEQEFDRDDPAKWDDPDAFLRGKVWPGDASAPRDQTTTEVLEAARTAKRLELEAAFNQAWTAQFSDPVFAVVAYFELKADPRTVAVTAAKNNLITKEQALSDLGRPGKPSLTLANIQGIVW